MKTKRPVKKQPETEAEFLAEAWESFNNSSSDMPALPPINYPYAVGQEVKYGAMQECRVEEVLDGGKLHISYHDRGQTYGTLWDNQRRLPRVVAWVDVTPLCEETETNFMRERIRCNWMSQELRSLLHNRYRRGFIDSPEYQRDYVWTLEDKQRLIGSIFSRTDVGKFVLLSHPYPENRLEIVDGKQRLGAICEYYENRFTFQGKTYYQLSWLDKALFQQSMVQVAQIDSETVSKSEVLWLFLSINAGGVPQTEEHVAGVRKMYEQALKEESKA